MLFVYRIEVAWGEEPLPVLPSLMSFTGIWDVPNARILPDWRLRVGGGMSGPYRYAGVGLGLFNRLELHGQFTEIDTIEPFPGEGFGAYKDRALGIRAVLVPETDVWPQVAIGAFDIIGTSLFQNRYVVLSKRFRDLDVTMGLGQGVLAGDGRNDVSSAGSGSNRGLEFLFSSPFRKTRPFAGFELHMPYNLVLAAEYSFIDAAHLVGYTGDDPTGLTVGLKWKPFHWLSLGGALVRGRDPSAFLAVETDLEAEGVFPWEKTPAPDITEKMRLEARQLDNVELARLFVDVLDRDGFGSPAAAVSQTSLWLEAENTKFLSAPKALARLGRIGNGLAPPRITTFYLNLVKDGAVIQSLCTNRRHFVDFLESRIDTDGFFTWADLDMHEDRHWLHFHTDPAASEKVVPRRGQFSFRVVPKIRTFLNNRTGFLKHKGLVEVRTVLSPSPSFRLLADMEYTFFNQYDELAFPALESESARTDLVRYERGTGFRLARLAGEYTFRLPWNVTSRITAGYLDTAYAGVGYECFRYFFDGRLGIGLETEIARKRDPSTPLNLDPSSDVLFHTAFLNLYAQPLPVLGLETGIKAGRFLGGDWGARVEIRRTFQHFTIGAWYTVTDTSVFSSPKNIGHHDKGVFIRIPLSVFSRSDVRGHASYALTGFTRDTGQTLAMPDPLFPTDNTDTPVQTRLHGEQMRW
ncbi:YjbH domain-containing protein [Desulfovibrio inopinatus]|uniref:YjbH domain-containing protein n=1 Tax=Desulfovibrio inopinatus TaxID=102109 RepID=UPI0004859516|nr:YjbH domain-containing protein [Desulfovibrio inopinatus]